VLGKSGEHLQLIHITPRLTQNVNQLEGKRVAGGMWGHSQKGRRTGSSEVNTFRQADERNRIMGG